MFKRHRSTHHKKCVSNGGTNNPQNLSMVREKDHQAWHRLFQNWSVPDIVDELNSVWIDPDYRISFTKVR
jgi:hypothetical protein